MKALQREIWKWCCSADEVNQTHKCRWSRGLFGGLFLFFSKKAVEQNDWPNFSPDTILHVHTAPNHQQAEPLEHMWGYVAEVHGQTPNSACMNLSMVIWFMYISMGERINVKCRLKHMWHIWSVTYLTSLLPVVTEFMSGVTRNVCSTVIEVVETSGFLRILIQEEIDFWSILFICCFCMSFSFGSLIWK